MPRTSEADLEEHVLSLLAAEGYALNAGSLFDPDSGGGPSARVQETPPLAYTARSNYQEVLLLPRLREAVKRLNPLAPPEAVEHAVHAVSDLKFTDLLAENHRIHRLLVDGVPVEYRRKDETVHDRLRLVDWSDAENDWLAVNQFTVVGASKRRPDVVLFLNGLPLVVVELKAAESQQTGVAAAYNQIQTYKSEIPALFRTNLFSVISDGFSARYGTISSGLDRFMAWRTVDGKTLVSQTDALALETLVKGLLQPRVLLDMLRCFTVFEDNGTGAIKKTAGYHQYHAALKGLASTRAAVAGNGKGGVVWHTQGSGKSLLMAFFGGLLIHEPQLENPTLLILTDRNDLDSQLYSTFGRCAELFGQQPQQVESVADLTKQIDRQVGGVIFSTIQKFRPEGEASFPVLTRRKNVIVFVDEAHRSQYGFAAKIDSSTGEKSYGFAHHVRSALPHATFIGFTGTPVELVDKNTKDVFGDYIDVYDIAQAVEDGATVPIHYEGKIVRLNLPENLKEAIDIEFDDATTDMDEAEKARLAQRWSRLEALAGARERLDELARLIVEHFERRQTAMHGKGMIVCMSRRICVELYDRLARLRPDWHDPADNAGKMKIVMTGSASDPAEFQPHVRNKPGLEAMATRFRNAKDPFQLVLVRDMWLTGFDSPSMHTLYVDKPMRGHNLMQAIARVNRIFKDKPAGLVVDTIGIATDLKEALSFYSDRDRDLTGIDPAAALGAFEDALGVMRAMFNGFDYRTALAGTPAQRLRALAAAVNHVYGIAGSGDEGRKAGKKRFLDGVAALERAFKLASGSDPAAAATDEVAFFSSVKVTLRKLEGDDSRGTRPVDLDGAIERLVNQAVVSTEVIDLLSAAGIKSPDISVLSDQFLKEMQKLPHQNLAVEALRRLLSGEVKSRTRTNVVRHRQFTERIADAMAKYHNRVLDAVQVIEELIRIAKELRDEPEDGLTDDEKALYDALADNENAMEVMGNDKLRLIASELVKGIRANWSVDWWRFDQTRSKIRVAVKRVLREWGYPPDLQDAAIKLVVMQAEALAAEVIARRSAEIGAVA